MTIFVIFYMQFAQIYLYAIFSSYRGFTAESDPDLTEKVRYWIRI